MKKKIAKRLTRRKQRIRYRLRDMNWPEQSKPMFSAANIHYEMADRARGLACGGIGMQELSRVVNRNEIETSMNTAGIYLA